ncbi:MAG: twin-arginine translocation signal domain-containing protein [Chloroflexota bacterium]|nr:twin-arginine translocation signal domain-containing protein [Chloroflexota bacterium]MBI5701998.1 twin-arginine translocation signal domain-containing protein [Chloroflexota bacterium]
MTSKKPASRITRRDFLKLAALSAGALAFNPFQKLALPEFPQADRLGRVTVGSASHSKGRSNF